MLEELLARHRGPYRLCVARPYATKPGFYRSEWLPGDVDTGDVEEEAKSLLSDPRDTITHVAFWSQREQAFCGGMARRDL